MEEVQEYKQQTTDPIDRGLRNDFPGLERLYTRGSRVALRIMNVRSFKRHQIKEDTFLREMWRLGTYKYKETVTKKSRIQEIVDTKPIVIPMSNGDEVQTYLDSATLGRFTRKQLQYYVLTYANEIFKTSGVQLKYTELRNAYNRRPEDQKVAGIDFPDIYKRDEDRQIDVLVQDIVTHPQILTDQDLKDLIQISQRISVQPARPVHISNDPYVVNNDIGRIHTLAERFHNTWESNNKTLPFLVPPPKRPLFFGQQIDRFNNLYKLDIESSFGKMIPEDAQQFFNQYYEPYYDKDELAGRLMQALIRIVGLSKAPNDTVLEELLGKITQHNHMHLLDKANTGAYSLVRLWIFDWPAKFSDEELNKDELFSGFVVEQLQTVAGKGRQETAKIVLNDKSTIDYIFVDPDAKKTKRTGNGDVLKIEGCRLAFGHRNVAGSIASFEDVGQTGEVREFDAAPSNTAHIIQMFKVSDSAEEDDVGGGDMFEDRYQDDTEDDASSKVRSLQAHLQQLHDSVSQQLNRHVAISTEQTANINNNVVVKYKDAAKKGLKYLNNSRTKDEIRDVFASAGVKLTQEDMDVGYDRYVSLYEKYKRDAKALQKTLEHDIQMINLYLEIEKRENPVAGFQADMDLDEDIITYLPEFQWMTIDRFVFIVQHLLEVRVTNKRVEFSLLEDIRDEIVEQDSTLRRAINGKVLDIKDGRRGNTFTHDEFDTMAKKRIVFKDQVDLYRRRVQAYADALKALLQQSLDKEDRTSKDKKSIRKMLRELETITSNEVALDALRDKAIKKKFISKKHKFDTDIRRLMTKDVVDELEQLALTYLDDALRWTTGPLDEDKTAHYRVVRQALRNGFIRDVEKTLQDMEGKLSWKEHLVAEMQRSFRLINGDDHEDLPAHIFPAQVDLDNMLGNIVFNPNKLTELIERQQEIHRNSFHKFKNFGPPFDHEDEGGESGSESEDESDSDSEDSIDLEIIAKTGYEEGDHDTSSDEDDDESSVSDSDSIGSESDDDGDDKGDYEDEESESEDVQEEEDDTVAYMFGDFQFQMPHGVILEDPAAFYVINQLCHHIACVLQNHQLAAVSNLMSELFRMYHVVTDDEEEDNDDPFPTQYVTDLIANETSPQIRQVLDVISKKFLAAGSKDDALKRLIDLCFDTIIFHQAWQNQPERETDLSLMCLYELHHYIHNMFFKPRTDDRVHVDAALEHFGNVLALGQKVYLTSIFVLLRHVQYTEIPLVFGDHVLATIRACARNEGGKVSNRVSQYLDANPLTIYKNDYRGKALRKDKDLKLVKEIKSRVFTPSNLFQDFTVEERKVEMHRQTDPLNTFDVVMRGLFESDQLFGRTLYEFIKKTYMDQDLKEYADTSGLISELPFGSQNYKKLLISLNMMYAHSANDFKKAYVEFLKHHRKGAVSAARSQMCDHERNMIRVIATGMMVIFPVLPYMISIDIQTFMRHWINTCVEFQNVLDVLFGTEAEQTGLIVEHKGPLTVRVAIKDSFDDIDAYIVEKHPHLVDVSDPGYVWDDDARLRQIAAVRIPAVQPGRFYDENEFFKSLRRFFTEEGSMFTFEMEDQSTIPRHVFANELRGRGTCDKDREHEDTRSRVSSYPLSRYMDQSEMVRHLLSLVFRDNYDTSDKYEGTRRTRTAQTGLTNVLGLLSNRMNILKYQSSKNAGDDLKEIFPPNSHFYIRPPKKLRVNTPEREYAFALMVAIDTVTGYIDRDIIFQSDRPHGISQVAKSLAVMFNIQPDDGIVREDAARISIGVKATSMLSKYMGMESMEDGFNFLLSQIEETEGFNYDSIKYLRPVYYFTRVDDIKSGNWLIENDLMIVYSNPKKGRPHVIIPHRSEEFVWARSKAVVSNEMKKDEFSLKQQERKKVKEERRRAKEERKKAEDDASEEEKDEEDDVSEEEKDETTKRQVSPDRDAQPQLKRSKTRDSEGKAGTTKKRRSSPVVSSSVSMSSLDYARLLAEQSMPRKKMPR